MGRNSTGSITTAEALRIELSYLLHTKLIEKGKRNTFFLSWNNGSKISCIADYTNNQPYLRLTYTATNGYTGEKSDHNDTIYLTTTHSNLGKGEILYFVCPETGKRCRILYNCYGSGVWKCRAAYQYRIYYPSQISSKLDFWNTRYWQLEHQIRNLQSGRRNQATYNNRPTKFANRLERLKQQRENYELMRWQPFAIPKRLHGIFNGESGN